ncbi:unnamed protein product [Hymenolepis diminuta]|uniref:ShKT domain-containing protein n=1 Tax=Hymenolepis diminuta TaxID=6216 RepID=A0A564XYK1_HYMDI|nr:unnamed protein product [Hymenolepis diminuta]
MARNHLIILPLLALALIASANHQHQPQGHHPRHEHSPQHWHPQCFCTYYPTFKCCKKPQLPECHKPKRLPAWTPTYNKCVGNCGPNLHCIDYCQNRFHKVPYFPKCNNHHYGHYGHHGHHGHQGQFQDYNRYGHQASSHHHFHPQFLHIPHDEPKQLTPQDLITFLSDNSKDYSDTYEIDRVCTDYCSLRFCNKPVTRWNKICTAEKSCHPHAPCRYPTACNRCDPCRCHRHHSYHLLNLEPKSHEKTERRCCPNNFYFHIKKYKKCMKVCKKYCIKRFRRKKSSPEIKL